MGYKCAIAQKIITSRQQLATHLQTMNFKVWPSHANFLLVQPPTDCAEQLYKALKERQIMIRYFNQPGLDDKLRITVGTPEQNARLVRTIAAVL